MKYIDEYRDEKIARTLLQQIAGRLTREWVVMEVCGGQTHTIVKYGIDRMLPEGVRVVHGPGCPVCVTPVEKIDQAIAIAQLRDVIFCSFGDMMRVPGSETDLHRVKAGGGDVRVVYSPLDALTLARENPAKRVVFFAVGFETTAPANAFAAWQARQEGMQNFFMLVSHVRVPPALSAVLTAPDNRVQGFLAAGHVCAVMGTREYEPLAEQYHVPIVPTGFEPLDLLEGIDRVVRQLEAGEARVENQYTRVVTPDGNRAAQERIFSVFEICDQTWRGIGEIPASGFRLKNDFAAHDAAAAFDIAAIAPSESSRCMSGDILQGRKTPADCPAFGNECTPANPLGATMVSSEGACAAFYHFGRHEKPASETPREG